MDTNYKMSGLEIFKISDLEIFLRTLASCNVFELASAICILFIFGQIMSYIIIFWPNSKICYLVQS